VALGLLIAFSKRLDDRMMVARDEIPKLDIMDIKILPIHLILPLHLYYVTLPK
jgi:hypothetical protein